MKCLRLIQPNCGKYMLNSNASHLEFKSPHAQIAKLTNSKRKIPIWLILQFGSRKMMSHVLKFVMRKW